MPPQFKPQLFGAGKTKPAETTVETQVGTQVPTGITKHPCVIHASSMDLTFTEPCGASGRW